MITNHLSSKWNNNPWLYWRWGNCIAMANFSQYKTTISKSFPFTVSTFAWTQHLLNLIDKAVKWLGSDHKWWDPTIFWMPFAAGRHWHKSIAPLWGIWQRHKQTFDNSIGQIPMFQLWGCIGGFDKLSLPYYRAFEIRVYQISTIAPYNPEGWWWGNISIGTLYFRRLCLTYQWC